LKLFINAKACHLFDPKNLAQRVSNIGQWGNGGYQIQV
jgi:predicted transport protein